MENKLFKAFGIFWEPRLDIDGNHFISTYPFCSNNSCRSPLEQNPEDSAEKGRQYFWLCSICGKRYNPGKNYQDIALEVNKMFQGWRRRKHEIYSLELVPTKVRDESEDDNYWVQATMGEKNGKLTAVVYFGKKIREKQDKNDYSQIFIDLEEEQLRFDKNNKNPMSLLCKLDAEFPNSSHGLKSKKNGT